MKFGIVGPISKDQVVWPNGETVSKFGAVVYSATVLARLLEGTQDHVICLSHVSPNDLDQVAVLFDHPHIELTGVSHAAQTGTAIELRYIDEHERTSCQTQIMTPVSDSEFNSLLECEYVILMPLNDTDISLEQLQQFRLKCTAVIFLDVHGLITGVDQMGQRFKKYWQNAKQWLACIDILKMNEKEASWAAGRFLKRYDDYLQYALSVVREGLTACWITFGDQSSLIAWQRQGRMFWAAVPVTNVGRIIDTIGCGDSASAGFIYAYARMHSALIGVVMGNMLGSVKASILESSEFPTKPEVRDMIYHHYRDYFHQLVDEFLSQEHFIVHEVEEEAAHESSLYSTNGHRYNNRPDHSRGSYRQGTSTPWS